MLPLHGTTSWGWRMCTADVALERQTKIQTPRCKLCRLTQTKTHAFKGQDQRIQKEFVGLETEKMVIYWYWYWYNDVDMDLFWICFGSLSCNSEGQMRHWPNSLHLDCNYCHVQSDAFSQLNDGILHHNPDLNLVPLRFIGTSNAFSQDCGHPAFVVPRLLPWIWWPYFFGWQCGEPWWTWKKHLRSQALAIDELSLFDNCFLSL